MNLDEAVFDFEDDNGLFAGKSATISDLIGARKLGYNLTEVPPGKSQCPFHSHHAEEEMFLILEGTGELRFGHERYPLRKHDVIACPTGGAEVAHQIINTGNTPLRYLSLSTVAEVEACEYPDSNKVATIAGPRGNRSLRKVFHADAAVPYFSRESDARDMNAE
ncbi:cupin domain-containing protein [Burkholderiaceae bacterium DAT-1]|nr:cupin domain-containing protein [Burkholderiaceae bacterium DAT-1]